MAKYKRTIGPGKEYKYSGRIVRYDGLYTGFVKDNSDAQRMGRLRVWIPEFGSRADDESGWATVSYISPFAGATNPDIVDNNTQKAGGSQTSYGWWAVPPDLENQVVIMFINGDPSRGVWLGCLFQQYMNNMVPGIPAGTNYQHQDKDLPVSEYNKKTTENIRNDITRPELTGLSSAIAFQGLVDDHVRGVTDTSARRETPSEVYGLLTPGPVDPDSSAENPLGRPRLGGHQFYFDDGEGREHMRVRTRNGAQLLLDDTNGLVYAINRDGTSWIQMDAEGNVDIFSAKSVSVRSQEDVNFRADRDLNLEAGRNLNIKARKDYLGSDDGSVGDEDAGSGGDITMQAIGNMQTVAKGNVSLTVTDGNVDTNVSGTYRLTTSDATDISIGGALTISSSSTIGLDASNIDFDTSGNLQVQGNAIASGTMYASDFKAGSVGLVDHEHTYISPQHAAGPKQTSSHSGGGGSSSASGPTAAEAATSTPVSPTEKTNVLATFSDEYNFVRDTETVLTVVGRFITYEPCPEHTNKGTES